MQQAGQLELSVGTVGVLESNMQIWHKRLVDKENEVEKLNKVGIINSRANWCQISLFILQYAKYLFRLLSFKCPLNFLRFSGVSIRNHKHGSINIILITNPSLSAGGEGHQRFFQN